MLLLFLDTPNMLLNVLAMVLLEVAAEVGRLTAMSCAENAEK